MGCARRWNKGKAQESGIKAQAGSLAPLLGRAEWPGPGPSRGARERTETASARARERRRRGVGLYRALFPSLTNGTPSTARLRYGSRHSATRRRNVVINMRGALRPLAGRKKCPYLERRVRKAKAGPGMRCKAGGAERACEVAASEPLTPVFMHVFRSQECACA